MRRMRRLLLILALIPAVCIRPVYALCAEESGTARAEASMAEALPVPAATPAAEGDAALTETPAPDRTPVPESDRHPVNARCTVAEVSNAYLDIGRLWDQAAYGVPMRAGDTARFAWTDELECETVYWRFRLEQPTDSMSLSFFDAEGRLIERLERPGVMEENLEYLPEGTRSIVLEVDTACCLSELALYAPGAAPATMTHFEPPLTKADLLLVVAHPDDEHAMMGGIVPYYDAERGYAVQVASVTHGYVGKEWDTRRLEFRRGLYSNKLTHYPLLLGLLDNWFDTGEIAISRWNQRGQDVVMELVRLIRHTRPDVAVTHDLEGEYGHGAHIAVAHAMAEAVRLAADPQVDPESAEQYGIWQVKKLYIHLYPEHRVTLDLDAPLAAFQGKSAREMAVEGMAYHESQKVVTWQQTILNRTYDSAVYGLFFSTVGYEESGTDFFENLVPPAQTDDAEPVPTATQEPCPSPDGTAAPDTPAAAEKMSHDRWAFAAIAALLLAVAAAVLIWKRHAARRADNAGRTGR